MINRVKHNTDDKYCVVNVMVINQPQKSSLTTLEINLTTEVLEKMTVFVKLFYQNDKQYRKEFLRTSFDLEKLFSGGVDSFIGKTIFGGLAEAADFPLKFPFRKVIFYLIFNHMFLN